MQLRNIVIGNEAKECFDTSHHLMTRHKSHNHYLLYIYLLAMQLRIIVIGKKDTHCKITYVLLRNISMARETSTLQ